MTGVSQLMQDMADAGAPIEAIIIAVRALEAKDTALEARRANDRERKQRQRARDSHGTVTGQSADKGSSPQSPPLKVSPDPYKNTPPLTPQPKPAIEQAIEDWNATAERASLPKVRTLAGKRKAAVNARLAEHGLDGWREALSAVERSPFCRGEKTDWRADIGFMARPDNFAKLLEGGFDPPPVARQRSTDPPSYLDHVLAEEERRGRRVTA